MMKLSIILPVYNVAQYLDACISSLCCQDIRAEEYEIICVNDGSTDNSLDVLTKICEKYTNITIINQENKGVSRARNVGLEYAKGKYVWFVDPDDFIRTMCFGTIVHAMDLYCSDYFLVDVEACEEDDRPSLLPDIPQIDTINQKKSPPKASGCQYIARRDFLIQNQISFCEKLQYGEDYLWALRVWLCGNSAVETSEKIYFYRTRNNSAMSEKSREKTLRHIYSMINLAEEYRMLLSEDWTKEKRREIEKRIPECTQAVLWDLALTNIGGVEECEIMNIMKQKQLYPYKIQWKKLKPSDGFSHTMMNYASLLFPKEWYYFTVKKCVRMIKGE